MGVKFTSAKWYLDWDDDFTPEIAQGFSGQKVIPELTWQPQINGGCILYQDVIAGKYDPYLNRFIQDIKRTGVNIRIALAPEMNGAWAAWAVGNCGNSTSDFVSFWRYVVDKFRQQSAPIAWIWSPNIRHWGETATFASIYPGDNYVDFLGVEGYNWGTTQSWSEWQSFKQVFLSSYNDLVAISPKNIIITEFASAEQGGNKAQWILDMFTDLKSTFPRISGITWFNMNKETDWRINSSAASEAAFREGARKFFTTDNPIVGINQNPVSETSQSTIQKIDKSTIAQNNETKVENPSEQANDTDTNSESSNTTNKDSNASPNRSNDSSQALFFIIWIGSIMLLLPITIWLAVK